MPKQPTVAEIRQLLRDKAAENKIERPVASLVVRSPFYDKALHRVNLA